MAFTVVMRTRPGITRLDLDRTTWDLLTGSQIKDVQTLMIGGRRLTHGHHVDGSVRSFRSAIAINHRRCRYADFWGHLATSSIIRWSFSRAHERRMPVESARIRVKSIGAIMFGGDNDEIVATQRCGPAEDRRV